MLPNQLERELQAIAKGQKSYIHTRGKEKNGKDPLIPTEISRSCRAINYAELDFSYDGKV